LAIASYTLLDLRAGIGSANDRWKLSIWGRNVTNKYYWTNAYKLADISARFAGRPATYGATLSFRY
jgi:outer membrane receptor protein involved in Fe transport